MYITSYKIPDLQLNNFVLFELEKLFNEDLNCL